MLVRFNDVSRSFGAFDVLRNVTFEIRAGAKAGLIGPNGSGKTTLLDLFEHPEAADNGTVARASGLRIGRLEQMPDPGDTTVFDVAVDAFAALQETERRIGELESAISRTPDDTALLETYARLQHDFEFRGGYRYRADTEAALFGLGFSADQLSRPACLLSGGETNRLALARLLLAEVDLLLLDEPTNHLDIRAIEWLEHFLRDTPKALVVVSHDRFFLDRVVNRILDLEGGRIVAYAGNYSAFLRQRAERRAVQLKEWERQQEWIQKTEEFIRKNLAGQKTKQAQSRRNALERLERIERPPDDQATVRFKFASSARTGRNVLTARGIGIGYPDKRIASALDLDIERGQRWALLGPNGSGKTTLLKTCTHRLRPLEGDLVWDERAVIGYYDQLLDDLTPGGNVLEELRRVDTRSSDGDLRSFLAGFLFRADDVFKPVAGLSGGEKSRLALAKIIYTAPPLLALDEPTNHLDIAAREALESALIEYPGTMLFVTHDRRLVERIATHILYISGDGVEIFDRFDRFEQWLGNKVDGVEAEATPPGPSPAPRAQPAPAPALSKNRRDQLERAARDLESQIESNEGELEVIERRFQETPLEIDWDKTNREYANLKKKIEALYSQLDQHLEELEAGSQAGPR